MNNQVLLSFVNILFGIVSPSSAALNDARLILTHENLQLHKRDSVKCGCGRRMRMADGGRRTADGGRDSCKKKISNITFREII